MDLLVRWCCNWSFHILITHYVYSVLDNSAFPRCIRLRKGAGQGKIWQIATQSMHAVLHNMLHDIIKVELADAVDFKAAPSGAVMHVI